MDMSFFTVPHLIAMVLAYLIGSIPTGYLVAKQMAGIDIREHGSGNTGATNVKRVVGNKAGLIVLICDFLKAFLPVFAARLWILPDEAALHVVIGVIILIGHSKSIFLNFTGGKSAISGLGVIVALTPLAGLLIGLLVFTLFKLTRIVSVASITACILTPITQYYMGYAFPYVVFGILGGLLIIIRHRSNITRLLQGTENRV